MRHDVGAAADFEEGRARIIDIGGREIGVVLWQGRPYALRSRCPHMGAPLCAGVLGPRLVSQDPVAPMDADQSRPVFTCPWHGWAFDLMSGYAVFEKSDKKGPRQRVPTYPATISGGRVFVEVGAPAVPKETEQAH